ncbi:MAG: nickel pincer cofactor biosynthesis protein LarC [Spirochaetia bacterium]|jgi:uncharacterized protein (TIGR00299 family) protein|nr:nickel pincer cofactor biosynthesis protein LarC [Spirochaetia bacterium]
MKTLYLECTMGASGDMLTGALLELLPDAKSFMQRLNGLQIPGVSITSASCTKCGIVGTHVTVSIHGTVEGEVHTHEEEHNHHGHEHHHHEGLHGIEHIVHHLDLDKQVESDVLNVYQLLAEAESHAHQMPVEMIHFHEVGMMDAVADIVSVCMLIRELAPEKIVASPVNVGKGQVSCAHGILPVPAPATAYLLKGIPTYNNEIEGELCTPTGAALLKYFVNSFGPMPLMATDAIGYGMGSRDFPAANCLRTYLGNTGDQNKDTVISLSCNLDDMTGEDIGYAEECLLTAGALDVYTIPIGMKKGRPAVRLCCMCNKESEQAMVALLFRHTTTLGMQRIEIQRYVLERNEKTVQTDLGPVEVKQATGWNISKKKFAYEDLAGIAKKHNMPLSEVRKKMPQ